MSARISDEELARYYDGELSPVDSERVERLLRDDPQAEQALQGLEQLGDVMRAWADRRGAAHDDVVNDVMARIARDGVEQPESRVVPLHGARRLRRAAVVITGALSLAAAAAVAVRVAQAPPAVVTPTRPVVHAPSLVPPAANTSSVAVAEAQLEADPAAAIETVDFGAHAGSIFVIAGTEGDVPVVWLLDDAADRIKPL